MMIDVSEDYKLHVTVTPTQKFDQYHLKIESQWLGAKNPDARHVAYSVTLPRHQMRAIAVAVLEGLA
jgi:hypothetical protein